jgi:hypothetical protein
MSTEHFQFSEAAKLYAKNMDLMLEMREETFRSIAEFGDKLLKQLPIELSKGDLCQKRTASGGAYIGCDICYLWIGLNEKEEWKQRVGMINIVLPILGKILSEYDVQSEFAVFDIASSNRIRVGVRYQGSDDDVRNRIMGLASNGILGELVTRSPTDFILWIPFEPGDPVGSAAKRLAVLLRAVRSAQMGR